MMGLRSREGAEWLTRERRRRRINGESTARGQETDLLSSSASSTWDVLSLDDTSRDSWLMQDRNFRISLVLSVFPAPLSPLTGNTHTPEVRRFRGAAALFVPPPDLIMDVYQRHFVVVESRRGHKSKINDHTNRQFRWPIKENSNMHVNNKYHK